MSHFYRDETSGSLFLPFLEQQGSASAGLSAVAPNTTDAAQEKHVPEIHVDGNRVVVDVGSAAHPMQDEHYITAIYLETKLGGQLRRLSPGEKAQAVFLLADNDEPVAAYEYCNLHGLWKADI